MLKHGSGAACRSHGEAAELGHRAMSISSEDGDGREGVGGIENGDGDDDGDSDGGRR